MISKRISIFVLLILPAIYTSEARSKHNHRFGKKLMREDNDQRKPVISQLLTKKILTWLNKVNSKPKAVVKNEQQDGFPRHPKVQITRKELGYGIPLNTYDLNKIAKRRYHIAPGPQIISNGMYNPNLLKEKEFKYDIPFNDGIVPQAMTALDINNIEKNRDYNTLYVRTPPQTIPNVGSENNTLLKYDSKKIQRRPDSLTLQPEIITTGESNFNLTNIYDSQKFVKEKHRSRIPAQISLNEKSKYKIASNYVIDKLKKYQDHISSYPQNSPSEKFNYNNDKVKRFLNEYSVRSYFNKDNIAKHQRYLDPQVIANEESQYYMPFYSNIINNDEKFKYNIPSTYETNKYDEHRNRILLYTQDGKFKYITSPSYNSNKLQSEYFPALHSSYSNDFPRETPHTAQGLKKISEWILEQLKVINIHENGERDKIDLKDVRNSILQILKKNGMSITAKGMLIDSQGTLIDFHKLNLIPILIQSTRSLGKILESRNGEIPSKQMQLPYLQAILITTTYPTKILGILPLKITYFPLLKPSNISNIQKTNSETGKYIFCEFENEDDIQSDIFPYYFSKTKLDQPPTNIFKKSCVEYTDEEEIVFPPRRVAPDNMISNSFSKTHVLEQEEIDHGRIFFPNRHEELDIFSRSQDIPLTITVKKNRDSAKMHSPSMLQDLVEPSFGNRYAIDNTEGKQSDIVIKIPTKFIASKHVPISIVVRKDSDAIPTLRKLSLIDTTSMSKDFNSIGNYNNANRRFEINSPLSESLAILNIPDERGVFFNKAVPKMLRVNSMPSDNLKSSGVITQNRGTPDLVFPFESYISSRSGTSLPEISPENDSNGIQIPHVEEEVEAEDDDDDYDDYGDFRIIGGNAATGSGTPLSNKGRSGRNF